VQKGTCTLWQKADFSLFAHVVGLAPLRKENAERFVLNLRLVVSLVSSVDPIRQREMVIERVMLFTSSTAEVNDFCPSVCF
jgi:hypothetical protein